MLAHAPNTPAATYICDFNLRSRRGIANVARARNRTAEPDTHWRRRMIETGVVDPRRNDVFGALARHTTRNKIAHEQSGNRGIAVGKMEGI